MSVREEKSPFKAESESGPPDLQIPKRMFSPFSASLNLGLGRGRGREGEREGEKEGK